MFGIVILALGVLVGLPVMIGFFRYPEKVFASNEGLVIMCGGALVAFTCVISGICLLAGVDLSVDLSKFWGV